MNEVISTINSIKQKLLGKTEQVELCACAFLANGNILIEDQPGVGKTTLAKGLASAFHKDLGRIQLTSETLPSDILGFNMYSQESHEFKFQRGPIFSDILLADELNRASTRTQSALLEAMSEKNVTIDGITHSLSEDFIVIATQNPIHHYGTNTLPESQLDRFMIRISIGHTDRLTTIEILKNNGNDKSHKVSDIKEKITSNLNTIKENFKNIHIDDSIFEYIYDFLELSRKLYPASIEITPLSNRAAIDLVRMSKAYAFIKERNFVSIDDIIYLIPYVFSHRLHAGDINTGKSIINELLKKTHIRK